MTDRPRDIIAVYGADPARWPADERDAVLAALGRDAGLRAERDAAAGLDLMLDEWARRDLADGQDAGAAAARVLAPRPGWLRWAAGGGIAAALGATVMLVGPTAHTAAPVTQAAATITDEGAFTAVFTTTPDEESPI